MQSAFELRAPALLVLLAGKARLHRFTGCLIARDACRIAAHIERMPAAVELDYRAHYGTAARGEIGQLGKYRVGFAGLRSAARHRIEPLLRDARDAAILAFRRIREFAQTGCAGNTRRRRLARFGMTRGERQLDQQIFVIDCGEHAGATLRVMQCIECIDEAFGKRRAHCVIGFCLPRGGELARVGATARRGNAHFGCRISGQQMGDIGGIGLQLRHAQRALRRIRMLVLRRRENKLLIIGLPDWNVSA